MKKIHYIISNLSRVMAITSFLLLFQLSYGQNQCVEENFIDSPIGTLPTMGGPITAEYGNPRIVLGTCTSQGDPNSVELECDIANTSIGDGFRYTTNFGINPKPTFEEGKDYEFGFLKFILHDISFTTISVRVKASNVPISSFDDCPTGECEVIKSANFSTTTGICDASWYDMFTSYSPTQNYDNMVFSVLATGTNGQVITLNFDKICVQEIVNECMAEFTYEIDDCGVLCTNNNSTIGISYQWTLDGPNGYNKVFTSYDFCDTLPEVGLYDLRLIIFDGGNCEESIEQTITADFDHEMPVIDCWEDFPIPLSQPNCETDFQFPSIDVSDNVDMNVQMTCTLNGVSVKAGQVVPIGEGIYKVVCIAVDACGNVSDTCMFNIIGECEEVEPFCTRFDEFEPTPLQKNHTGNILTLLNNWQTRCTDIQYSNTNSINGPTDIYLRAEDVGCGNAGSWIFNNDDYKGDWTTYEGCFCFDFRIFNGGGSTSTPNALRIYSGGNDPFTATHRAVFKLNNPISIASGWTKICTPTGLSIGGSLPSTIDGQWEMEFPVSATTADWDQLIANIDGIAFAVDITGSPTEKFGYDNICIEPCPPLCIEEFEDEMLSGPSTSEGNWLSIAGDVAFIIDPITGSQVLQGLDGSGGSWMVDTIDFKGDWDSMYPDCEMCFDIRYDANDNNNPNLGYNTIYIFDDTGGSTNILPTNANWARFRFNQGIDNNWIRVCAPVSFQSSGVPPSNALGQWVESSPGAFNSIIKNVHGVAFVLDFAGGGSPSEELFVDNFCLENCDPYVPPFCGYMVATCMGTENVPDVGVLFDSRYNSNAPIGGDWNDVSLGVNQVPSIHPAMWNINDIGQIFGIATDDAAGNIYFGASDVYKYDGVGGSETGFGGSGGIYHTAFSNYNLTTALCNTINVACQNTVGTNQIPNTAGVGNGIGNLVFDEQNRQLFASNLEDGSIYRIDILTGNILSIFDPFVIDNCVFGIAPLDEQIWGIAIYNNRLYYARNNGVSKFIYSIGLDGSGEFMAAEQGVSKLFDDSNPALQSRIEVAVPGKEDKITDIAFSASGNMLLSERGNPHSADIFEFTFSGGWVQNSDFNIGGQFGGGSPALNAAGGVEYGPKESNGNISLECDALVWATGNYMMTGSNGCCVYGVQGMDSGGNSPLSSTNATNDLYLDLNSSYSPSDKFGVGDVELFQCNCPSSNGVECDSLMVMSTLKPSMCIDSSIILGLPCTFEFDPVCGCDGITYSNACHAGEAGVTVVSKGECNSENTPEVKPGCCYDVTLKNNWGSEIVGLDVKLLSSGWIFSNVNLNAPYMFGNCPVLNDKFCILGQNGLPIPDSISLAMDFCLVATDTSASNTQLIEFSWIQQVNQDSVIVCRDTLILECTPPPPVDTCLTINEPMLNCDPEDPTQYDLCFTVTNNSPFDIWYITLDDLTLGFHFAPGVPNRIYFPTPNPLTAGSTSQQICIKVFSLNPITQPDTLCLNLGAVSIEGDSCCHDPIPICIPYEPCCDPCEQNGIIATSISNSEEECCYSMSIINECQIGYFTKLELDITTSGVCFGSHVLNPAQSSNYIVTGTASNLCITPIGGTLPFGTINNLISFCLDKIDDSAKDNPQIIIKWHAIDPNSDEPFVACQDTLITECTSPDENQCVEVTDQEMICVPDSNKYRFTFTVTNKSNLRFIADKLHLFEKNHPNDWVPSLGNIIQLPSPLDSGQSVTITTCILGPTFPAPFPNFVFGYRLQSATGNNCCYESVCDTISVPPCDSVACPKSEQCLTILDIEAKNVICDSTDCHASPFCQSWLRGILPHSNCNVITTVEVSTAIYNGNPVIVIETNSMSDQGFEISVYDCRGNELQSCNTIFSGEVICSPDPLFDPFVELTSRVIIWQCGDPVPALPIGCTSGNMSIDYCITVQNNSGFPVTQVIIDTLPGQNVTITPSTINIPPLNPGNSTVINFNVIGNLSPGDIIKANIMLQNMDTCCMNIEPICLEIPACPTDTIPEGCCDISLEEFCNYFDVLVSPIAINQCEVCYDFSDVDPCDAIGISIDGAPFESPVLNTICYANLSNGIHTFCFEITRTDSVGITCHVKDTCYEIFIECPPIENCCDISEEAFCQYAENVIIPIASDSCSQCFEISNLDSCDVVTISIDQGPFLPVMGNNICFEDLDGGEHEFCYKIQRFDTSGPSAPELCQEKIICDTLFIECIDPCCDISNEDYDAYWLSLLSNQVTDCKVQWNFEQVDSCDIFTITLPDGSTMTPMAGDSLCLDISTPGLDSVCFHIERWAQQNMFLPCHFRDTCFVFDEQCPPMATCPSCPFGSITGSDLIINGDFENGKTGFTSGYTASGLSTNTGQYDVKSGSVFGTTDPIWAQNDHTFGTIFGKMLVANGPLPNTPVWSQTVSVLEGNSYVFCAWVNNLIKPDQPNNGPPQAEVMINGTMVLVPVTTIDVLPNNWVLITGTWIAPAGTTTATLEIFNRQTSEEADLAIDDITFVECSVPPSICCTDSIRFDSLVNIGWQVLVTDCEVTVIAPQFDTCHWFGTDGPDWGDGSVTSPVITPAFPTQTYTHSYTTPGTYNICITVFEGDNIDDACWSAQMCTPVTIEACCNPGNPCDSTDIVVSPNSVSNDSCCYEVTIDNNYCELNYFKGFRIDMTGSSSISSITRLNGYIINQINSNTAEVFHPSGFVPQGQQAAFTVCGSSSGSVTFTISWLIPDGQGGCEAICDEEFTRNCGTIDPRCVFILEDSIHCETNEYCVRIKNNSYPGFTINSIDLIGLTPGGASILPNPISVPSIAPGDTSDWICLTYSGVPAGDSICFFVVGHNTDITQNEPPTTCCADTVQHCFVVHDCCDADPCDLTSISVSPNSTNNDSCCYEVTIDNDYCELNYFKGFKIDMTGSSTISSITGLNGYIINQINSNTAEVMHPSGFVPQGQQAAFTVCGSSSGSVTFTISWLIPNGQGGCEAICDDDFIRNCGSIDPRCVFILEDSIHCQTNEYCVRIKNNSYPGFTINSIDLIGLTPSGASILPNPISIPSIAPGDTSDWICLTYSGVPEGDSICFFVVGHNTDITQNEPPTTCCADTVQHCFVVHDCPGMTACCTITQDSLDNLLNDLTFIIDTSSCNVCLDIKLDSCTYLEIIIDGDTTVYNPLTLIGFCKVYGNGMVNDSMELKMFRLDDNSDTCLISNRVETFEFECGGLEDCCDHVTQEDLDGLFDSFLQDGIEFDSCGFCIEFEPDCSFGLIFDYGDGVIDTLIQPNVYCHTYSGPGPWNLGVTIQLYRPDGTICLEGDSTYVINLPSCPGTMTDPCCNNITNNDLMALIDNAFDDATNTNCQLCLPIVADSCDFVEVIWGDGSLSSFIGDSIICKSYNVDSTYDVTMKIYRLSNDGTICLDTMKTVSFSVDNCMAAPFCSPDNITIFNAVSPNGDNLNEYLDLIIPIECGQVDLSIYNRWGQLVYTKQNYIDEWKGQSSLDRDLPDGTYYLILALPDARDEDGKPFKALNTFIDLRRDK